MLFGEGNNFLKSSFHFRIQRRGVIRNGIRGFGPEA